MALQPLPPIPNTRLVDDPARDAIWRRYLEQLFNRVIPLNTGTVTSINVSSVASGLTFTGGPVSTAGTIIMSGILNVSSGGSGAATLTGYLIGNGTSPFTATSAIHTSSLTGVLPIANGGTATSAALTSSVVMVSNGTAIVQGPQGTSTTVLHGNSSLPFYSAVSLTADVSGILPIANGGSGTSTGVAATLSSMAFQSSSGVAIVGGTINGVGIGATTASTGVFTSISTTVFFTSTSVFDNVSTRTIFATSTATFPLVNIDGGFIDSTAIGATTASTGVYTNVSTTTLFSTSTATLPLVNIDGGNIDSTAIGAATSSTGVFTNVSTATLFTSGNATIGDAAADTLTINAETVSQPNIPAFLAYNSATDANQTGNGALATVDFDTEVFDQSADFAADTFTAPATGNYFLSATVQCNNIPAGSTTFAMRIITSNATYSFAHVMTAGTFTTQSFDQSTIADMDSGDTAFVQVQFSGGAGDTAGIVGNATIRATRFSGMRVA